MTGIEAYFADWSEEGALIPRLDDETDILAIESGVSEEFAYGIDIDGLVEFDVDWSHRVVNIDAMIPPDRWLVRHHYQPVTAVRRATLCVTERIIHLCLTSGMVRDTSLVVSHTIVTNMNRDLVYLSFGETDLPTYEAAALSDYTTAVISDGLLQGIQARLR